MGYDCTLHVIDKTLIREEFVPRLLCRKSCESPFDSRSDAAEIWQRVRAALNGQPVDEEILSPKATARMVSQFAVLYCASVLPYHYDRGFCLSLREDLFDESSSYHGNPEHLFEELLAAHPELRGEFPQGIEQNYCTGVYIPARRVRKVLECLGQSLGRYVGLLLILDYAARNGLGYWEATDLPLEARSLHDFKKCRGVPFTMSGKKASDATNDEVRRL
jgi:hypothetical protein